MMTATAMAHTHPANAYLKHQENGYFQSRLQEGAVSEQHPHSSMVTEEMFV